MSDDTFKLTVPGNIGRILKPGDTVGDNYRLIALLGEGGMGVVYRCRHQIIDHEYALKILKPNQVTSQSWQRFQVEGRAIASLDHVNIVKIFNMGIDHGDCPYYVMELLEGSSLEDCIGSETLDNLDFALDIFKQLTNGLGYAHNKNIIHRDIKPDNIILQNTSGGIIAKIVDFGLAKLISREALMKQGLTSAGEIFGTPLYMSPEQSLGLEIDHRADIYSLGCTFFKTLTGKFPYCGKTAIETSMMHQTNPVPTLANAAPHKVFPDALEDILERMLAKQPDDRYQSMAEVSKDLDYCKIESHTGRPYTSSIKTHNLPSDEDVDTAGEKREPKFFKYIAIAITLVLLASGVGIALVVNQPSKQSAAVDTSGRVSVFTLPRIGIPANTVNSKMKKVIADFQKYKMIPTQVAKETGKPFLIFHFPETAVGYLFNSLGYTVEAKNTATLFYNRPVYYEVRYRRDWAAWENPWILSKIDAALIDDFYLNQEEYINEGSSDDEMEKGVNAKYVLEMTTIASKWKNLQGMHFHAITASKALLDIVQTIPILKRFKLSCGETRGSELAPYTFLSRLETLDISEMLEIDLVLKALSGSKTLDSLIINGTTPSVQGLRQLKNCPKLSSLYLEKVDLNDDQLTAISELPALRDLNLTGGHVNAEKLVSLKGFKKLHKLYLSTDKWRPDQLKRLAAALTHSAINGSANPLSRLPESRSALLKVIGAPLTSYQ